MTDTDRAGDGSSWQPSVLPELRALATQAGVKGTSGMRKGELIAAIQGSRSGGNGGAEKSSPEKNSPEKSSPEKASGHAEGRAEPATEGPKGENGGQPESGAGEWRGLPRPSVVASVQPATPAPVTPRAARPAPERSNDNRNENRGENQQNRGDNQQNRTTTAVAAMTTVTAAAVAAVVSAIVAVVERWP